MKVYEKKVFDYIRKIAKEKDPNKDTGFWVFTPDLLLDAIDHFHKAMGPIGLFYAVKCNPYPYIVQCLIDNHNKENDGFDCASINEIKEVLKLGGNPANIAYSQIAKTTSEVIEAYKLGVRITLVDCVEEVEKLSKIKDEVKDLQLLIRYQSNDPTAEYTLGGKFGAEEDEIDEILNLIYKYKLNFAGTHFHIGSNAHNAAAFENGIRIAKETFDKGIKLGYNPHIIDIGGGFSHKVSIDEFGQIIQNAVKKYGLEKAKIFAEPGRFIAANAMHYVSNVIARHKKEKDNLIYYSLDDGIHGNLAFCKLFHVLVECTPLNPRGAKKYRSIMGGQTCDSHDIICDFELEQLEIGDWVVFYCSGAYTMSIATNFNGFEIRTKPIYQMPTDKNETIKIPEELEKKGIPALWGLPNMWTL